MTVRVLVAGDNSGGNLSLVAAGEEPELEPSRKHPG
jgi:hypothetical protein